MIPTKSKMLYSGQEGTAFQHYTPVRFSFKKDLANKGMEIEVIPSLQYLSPASDICQVPGMFLADS